MDNTSRESVREFYNTYYLASDAAINWTGNHADCKAGDTAQAFKDDVLLRVNWFRVMAGVAEVTLDASFNDDCQKAALMVSKGGSTEHHPPPSWPCFSLEGSNATRQCNLSLGSTGWDAVTSQMRDTGGNNYPCGHRRWILYPQTRKTATGNIPATGLYDAAMALREWDEYWNTARPATKKEYVSWPPAGYVPYPVVFGRWSFSYADADFSSATVTMTANGTGITAPLETIDDDSYGENTLVWRPQGVSDTFVWTKPASDSNYTVQVSNVLIGGVPRTFNYTVTVFDPAVGGATPPATPGNVRASDGTYVNYVLVQWDSAADATFYQIWRNTLNDTDGATCIKERDLDLSFSDTTAVPEQQYYYFVRAGNDDGYSDYSAGNSGWAAMAVPAAPTGVKASDGTHEDRVDIQWNAVGGATLYQIWRNNSNSLNGAHTVKSVGGHLSSGSDYTATPGQGYYFWVRAENQGGWGPYSGSDSGHVAVAAAPPEAPDTLWASDGKYTNKVYLMMQIPPGTTGFDIWRAYQDNVDAATKIVGNHPSGEYSDFDVTPGLYYFYWVQARNADGVSGFSPGDSGYASNAVHAPAQPPCISASQGTYLDRVTIEFCPVEYRTAYHYEIWRNAVDNPAGATCIAVLDPTESEATDSNLEPGTTNYYYVTATNQYGRSPFSDSAKGYTMAVPPAPTHLAASDGTSVGSVLVNWSNVYLAHFSVWRHTNNTPTAASCIAPNLSQLHHIDYTAVPGQVYYYWVKAFSGSVTSEFSNTDTGYAGADNPPPPPENVQATRGVYNNFIGVTWDKVLDAGWYEVWRNTSDNTATATRRDSHTTNNVSWTDPAPSWLIGYYYWVRSVNENGTSTWSSAAYGYMAGPLSVPELRFTTRLGNIWVMTMTNLTVGVTNYIQSTTNLMPGSQWIQRGAMMPSRERSFWIGLMPEERRFYRIVVEPPDGP
ncbi:MAG: hypothetical protein KA248_06495 [Kiritimatiellae bacterium]|nr:hypothetical protein [Kiritimatiellia bacterium]